MALSPLGQAALDYVMTKGWKIYPLKPGTKIPLSINHTADHASNDPDQIRQWWTECPDANIAMRPGDNGLVIIDLDGPAAGRLDEFPVTLTVRTPGVGKVDRGYHLYYIGKGRTTQGVLGPSIDTLGCRGQAVLPPSRIGDKEYEFVRTERIADLPSEIAGRIVPVAQPFVQETGFEPDHPLSVAAARNLLNARSRQDDYIATSGQHGNSTTFKVAASLYDLGLSREKVFELMWEEYNPICRPPWSEKELRTIVDSAERNRQSPVGCKAPKPALLTGEKLLSLPDPEPIVPGLLQRNENIIFYGPPKIGKTYVLLDMALSIAAGKPVFGKLQPAVSGPTVYFSGEGHGGIKRRLLAWSQARGVQLTSVPFYYHIGVPHAKQSPDEYITRIKIEVGQDPVLIVIDTMARAMAGMDENSAADMGRYLELTEALRKAFPGCTVATIGHSGHSNAFRPRGSSNALAGLDGIWRVEANPRKDIRIIPQFMKDAEGLPRYCFRFCTIPVERKAPQFVQPQGSYLEVMDELEFVGPWEYLRIDD